MNIEQEVREMLSSKVRNAPGMVEPPQPVMRKARVRRARNGAGFAVVVALIATGSVVGVRSLVGTQPLEPTTRIGTLRNPIPWAPIDGGDLASYRPCRASDLMFFRMLSDVGAAELVPKSQDTRCAIDKGLDLRVFDSGKRIPVRIDKNAFDDALIIAGRIRAAVIPIGYAGPCVPFNGTMLFELVLPHGGGALRTPASAAGTACPADSPATIVIGQGSIDFGGYNYHNDLIPSIEGLPSAVKADGDIRYLVRLHNASDRAVSLDPCPVYEQEIQEEGGFKYLTTFRLNCADAPRSIAAGKSLVFEMVFQLQGTGKTPRGATLSWKIEGTGLNAAKNLTLR